jgi:hypothetical protein
MKTIFMKRPGEAAEQVDLPMEVSIWDYMKQELGEAYLQRIDIPTTGGCIDMWFDEEGKMKELQPNFMFPLQVGTMLGDFAAGTVFITGSEDGECAGLTDEEIEDAIEFFEQCDAVPEDG